MAGIYIHIPFCKQACHYCDFHFSTSLNTKDRFIIALLKEIELQKNYLQGEGIKTIYFGGGTPSILSGNEINKIIDELKRHHKINSDAEITLEANPDDLSVSKIHDLAKTPVNRLSIGIQSFFDEDLQWMNRAHNATQAKQCIVEARNAGFKNITIDFIYGTPTLSDKNWLSNLNTISELNIQHLSAYFLTVEPRTALASFIKKKKMMPPDEEQASRQFEMLMKYASENGFIHYEISNMGKEGFISQHNSSYWKGEKYLGLGPSAHSYNHISRQWNISNNNIYIQSIEKNKVPYEIEVLSTTQKFNEYLLTSLRTIWGCDTEYIRRSFPEKYYYNLMEGIHVYILQELIHKQHHILRLTNKGMLLADHITSQLFEHDAL